MHVLYCISKSYKSFFKILDPTWSYDTPLQNAPSPVTVFSPEKLTVAQEHTQLPQSAQQFFWSEIADLRSFRTKEMQGKTINP